MSVVSSASPLHHLALLEARTVHPTSLGTDLLRRGYRVSTHPTLATLRKDLGEAVPTLVIVHAASFQSNGIRLVQQVRQAWPVSPIILVVDAQWPAEPRSATVLLTLPFTPRKLHNAVRRLLPAVDEAYVQLGPIRLYASLRRVQVHGREQRLTPKQARLLDLFLRAPGQVISRRTILKKVWETDYLGDTRTLDVHISWLRHLIEPDPRTPRYLRTVRALGYRLDLPADPPA